MRPLFSEGEEVILQSNDCPHLNGEHVVLVVINAGEEDYYDPEFGGIIKTFLDSEPGYLLEGVMDPEFDNKCHIPFFQSALRKKYKGSDRGFNELIKDIKNVRHEDKTKSHCV